MNSVLSFSPSKIIQLNIHYNFFCRHKQNYSVCSTTCQIKNFAEHQTVLASFFLIEQPRIESTLSYISYQTTALIKAETSDFKVKRTNSSKKKKRLKG